MTSNSIFAGTHACIMENIGRQKWVLETEFLPLNCNWITSNLLPKYDEENQTFVEPFLPNYKIGIIHLAAGIWKNGKDMRTDKSIEIEIKSLKNNKILKSLRYRDNWKKIKFLKIGLINKGEIPT